MLVPLEWLKEYVDIDISTKELADRLTMTGTKVEAIEDIGKNIQNVVVGKILSVEPHPNADKLVICKVDVGKDVIQVVTGAPNVQAGQLVPVALHGALLPGGIKIKTGKLRGEISQGMMCSGEELGLTDADYPGAEADGIMILNEDYPLGMDIKEALQLGGEVIEFEITSNRPDCLSVLGIAREAAVATKKAVKYPKIEVQKGIGSIEGEASVIVEDGKLCPRYCARLVKDVKIGPSPLWMRRRLAAAGVRPINNIVDITNYVMLELGQPMHAFDADKIAQKTIIVRRARDGEVLITLDDQERKLDENTLIIADPEKPIALAGVMGGLNTEITDQTKNVLLESALFDGGIVRAAAKRLGLRSEASSRFEKGLDITNAERAMNRAIQLIQELGIGTVVEGMIDVCHGSLEMQTLEVPWKRINKLLGIDLTVEEISEILESLEFKVECMGDMLKVGVPSFRRDIEGVADLAEEVARIYGYNNIPMTLMENSVAHASRTREQILIDLAKETLAGVGLYEIVTYSFTSPDVYETIGFKKEEYPEVVKIANPLGVEHSIMRTTLIPSVLEVLSRNFNRRIDDCRVFEIANIYIPKSTSADELPDELLTLAIGEYGEGVDYYTLKGQVEVLLDVFGVMPKIKFVPGSHPTFHPGRTADIMLGEEKIGVIGEIHPKVAKNYKLENRVLVGELNFEKLMEHADTDKKYVPLPKYPAVTRDIAIVVDKKVLAGEIEEIILKKGGRLLEKAELFDVYEGDQIPEGYKSMAYALSFRALDRTLKDEEVDKIVDKIISELADKVDARLR